MFGPDRFGHDPRHGYGYGYGILDCCGPDLLSIIAGATLIVVHCLFIPGFSAPYWVSSDVNNVERHQGLWMICTDMDTTANTDFNCTDAIDASNLPDWFTATQSMMCISLICLIIATALIIYWLCSYSRFFFVKAIFICLLFLTFILSLVGVILYGINVTDGTLTATNYAGSAFDYDWCFYLVDVSTVIFLFLPVLMMCIPSRESYPYLEPRDRFGFGYPRAPPPRSGPGPMGPSRPRPYGGSRNPYPSLPPTLPYSNRY